MMGDHHQVLFPSDSTNRMVTWIDETKARGVEDTSLDGSDDQTSLEEEEQEGSNGFSFGGGSLSNNHTNNTAATKASEKEVFQNARNLLGMGKFYRFIVYIYAERKLLVFFWIHFVCTMIIWAHFGLIKFETQLTSVPEGVPRYWWKRMTPTLEFAAMHAILFQMALIPLTMCRYSIAALSESFVTTIIPLNRMLRMHIHLGYTMISIVFLAVIFFFTFFGLLCSDGDQTFCKKFTSEIMITGYVILVSLLVVGGTSYFRHKIPYELFYAIHHVVFLMFIVTIVHTIDMEQRKGRLERSQTFKWFSGTLLFYMCDRAAMHLMHKYRTKLVGSSVVYGAGGSGSKMVILKLNRPALFHFKPGQFAYLRVNEIDNHWHPFSIASGPESSTLEFYIEVYCKKSWTQKLLTLLDDGKADHLRLFVDIMGPYGTSLAKTADYSHIMAVGAGTGIVPILSLYKQHIRHLLQLDPDAYFFDLKERDRQMAQVGLAEESRKGSVASLLGTGCARPHPQYKDIMEPLGDTKLCSKQDWIHASIRKRMARHEELNQPKDMKRNVKRMKDAAFLATQSIYGIVLLTSLPVLGVTLLGLTISWNCLPIDLYDGMTDILKLLTGAFQCLFAIIAIFIWNANSLLAYVDTVICVIAPFADWYWFGVYNTNGTLRPTDIATYSLLIGYMTARLWAHAVMSRHDSRSYSTDRKLASTDKFELCWVTRSASQVSEILPDILEYWNALIDAWGLENTLRVCRVSIYVTDPDPFACEKLMGEFAMTEIVKQNALRFERPNFSEIVDDHMVDIICSRRKSNSLLAFCGSPTLATELHSIKISNDMVTAITGNKRHQMEYVSESYGGNKVSPDRSIQCDGDESKADDTIEGGPLTTRMEREYFSESSRSFGRRRSDGLGRFRRNSSRYLTVGSKDSED